MKIEFIPNITENAPIEVIEMIISDIKNRNILSQDTLVHMWFEKNGEHENVSAVLAYLREDKHFIWLHQWWHEDMGSLMRVEYETINDAGRIIFEEH